MVGWAGLNLFAFTHGVWLDTATTLVAAVPPVAMFIGEQVWAERRRTQSLVDNGPSPTQLQATTVTTGEIPR